MRTFESLVIMVMLSCGLMALLGNTGMLLIGTFLSAAGLWAGLEISSLADELKDIES